MHSSSTVNNFDETLAQNAQTAGADLLLEHKIVSAKKQENHITLTIQQNEQTLTVRCNILIGADGSHSSIRKIFGFPHPIEMLQGIGAELSDTTLDPRFVHIFVGHTIAPGFFAWIIPTNTKAPLHASDSASENKTTIHSNTILPPYFNNHFYKEQPS